MKDYITKEEFYNVVEYLIEENESLKDSIKENNLIDYSKTTKYMCIK